MCSESFSPTLVQFSPLSVDLKIPVPTEMLLSVQLSPVPAHTFLWLEGSMATAPMDWGILLIENRLEGGSAINALPHAPAG